MGVAKGRGRRKSRRSRAVIADAQRHVGVRQSVITVLDSAFMSE